MIDLADHIVFLTEPFRVEQKLAGIAADRSVGEGIEPHEGQNFRIDLDLGGLTAIGVGAQNAIVGVCRKGIIAGRQALYLVQAFIIGKEKGLIFPDRPAYGAPVLMAAKRRD